MDAYFQLDATAQAELVKSKQAQPIELLDATIARIEALNPALNAVTSPLYDEARRQAMRPLPDGPFKGVPHLVKDLSAVRGAPLTYGSQLFGRNIAIHNEAIVARSVAAGFVVCGKTNTPEFGLLPSTEPLLHGASRNPWNPEYSSGGSSGGAAAAVASGMVPLAQAGDGGGSIRIPASCCGVFGLKPSRNRVVPRMHKTPGDLAVNLCISRSVRDTARFLEITERHGRQAILPPLGYVPGASGRRLRIAHTSKDILGMEPAPEVKAAHDDAVRLCAELGHVVEEAELHVNGEQAIQNFIACWSAGPAFLVRNFWLLRLKTWQRAPITELLEPWTLGLANWYRTEEAKRPGLVARAVAFFESLAPRIDDFFSRYDVYLTPVLRRLPAKVGEYAPTIEFNRLMDSCIDFITYTPLHNAIGAPAMSVPLGESADGLPIGAHFAARAGDERTLLELAYELEQARPWANRWPPVSAASNKLAVQAVPV